MESEAFVRDMADRIHGIADTLKLRWVFKASYDKANRSSGSSFRGPGVEQGCKILGKIADEHGVLLLQTCTVWKKSRLHPSGLIFYRFQLSSAVRQI